MWPESQRTEASVPASCRADVNMYTTCALRGLEKPWRMCAFSGLSCLLKMVRVFPPIWKRSDQLDWGDVGFAGMRNSTASIRWCGVGVMPRTFGYKNHLWSEAEEDGQETGAPKQTGWEWCSDRSERHTGCWCWHFYWKHPQKQSPWKR